MKNPPVFNTSEISGRVDPVCDGAPIADVRAMRLALRLARKALGDTSPNPMVGAVLVRNGEIIGRGWHHRAGLPHAEIEAIRDAASRGHSLHDATLFVTLEPCCTHGRTPPCTDAILASGIGRVVVGAMDPNPKHAGRGLDILRQGGVEVVHGILAGECARLNEAFNHWIVHRTPFVTVKSAMTLDGKIATAGGQSRWITGEKARAAGMRLRKGSDAILVGVETVLADDPSLTLRGKSGGIRGSKQLRRIILDTKARTPLHARIVTDEFASLTTVVVGRHASRKKQEALARRARVLVAPELNGRVDVKWLLRQLGRDHITSLLVEGGGEVAAAFLSRGLAHRVACFYAPMILGGRTSRKAVSGDGAVSLNDTIGLTDVAWRKLGDDLMMTARVLQR